MKSLENINLLIVEDQCILRQVLASMLRMGGISLITEAENGECALQSLRDSSEPYDLIITDLYMPKLSGLELIKKVRTEFPTQLASIPIIVISGDGQDRHSDDMAKYEVSSFLEKPMNTEQLITAIKSALGIA